MPSRLNSILSRLPAHVPYVIAALGLCVFVFVLLRAAFWMAFHSASAEAPMSDVWRALYIGVKFDLRLGLWLTLPLFVLGGISYLNPARFRIAATAWLSILVSAFAVVLFLYFVDFGHYAYVHKRINVSLLEHLRPVSVAAQMAWQTYPVVWALALLALLVAVFAWALRALWQRLPTPSRAAAPRWRRVSVAGALVVLYVFLMWGKLSWYPLRWSEAYFTNHEAVTPLALNPILFFIDTADGKGERYNEDVVRENYDAVARWLGVTEKDDRSLTFARQVPARAGAPKRPLNLVVIHLESFAAFKTGAFGNRLDPTPNFDSLARNGTLFTHFFVPASPTARSVFTMLTGVPDYNGVRFASHNPLVVNQYTLINSLTGYERFYFLGGSATWGNIRGILSHNIHGLKVFEEGSYEKAERADAWGVTDHDLFEKAHEQFLATERPFFAFIQTSGNHRPYTIPDTNRRGFELRQADHAALRDNSFENLAAYNGIRFFDHALGHFFERARKSRYFSDTVFVMYGDHGNPSVKDIPFERLGLTGFHVPLLIYSPGQLPKGKTVEHVASLVDLMPTALGLLGVSYRNQTLGKDLLAPGAERDRLALVPEGILDDQFLYREGPDGVPRLYRYREADPARDRHAEYPEKTRALATWRRALFETSRYLLHHNRPVTESASSTPGVSPQSSGGR